MRIFSSASVLDSDRVRSLPRARVTSDWGTKQLPSSFCWALARDLSSLWFAAEIPGPVDFDSGHVKGSFVEGLWERDVVELFLAEPGGCYQEFNISPAGAWWCCSFESYRTRGPVQKQPAAVAIDVSLTPTGWAMTFAVKLSDLSIDLARPVSVHVSAIRYKPEPLFMSSRVVEGVEPDFHHAGCFVPVVYEPDNGSSVPKMGCEGGLAQHAVENKNNQ